ncbi:DnaJ domain-containing protein [Microbacterium sp. 179-I 3D4 NHS]|uniref:DnaJ domain-containing protein n=1 Tax=Microbacterium sp. 179-I 3D4 NHS TaxID=3142381 RepID=UPI0039A13BFF
MFDSPLSASAYEVLGVAADIDDEALRRAYRLRLRETHPDTGGDAAVFIRVQHAWELVGTPDARSSYDRRRGGDGGDAWRAPARSAKDTRPRPASYGAPGAWRRARYVALLQEWAGRDVDDPYAPALVHSAPRALRRLLADALAEEATADAVAGLGMGFTLWHGIRVGLPAGGEAHADEDAVDRLDHIVLGPSGLFGVMSADFGGIVGFRRGEITGPTLGHRAPVTSLLAQIRAVARATGVRFSGAIVVLPDDDLSLAATPLGTIRGLPVLVVRRSTLPTVLRAGMPGSRLIGGNELFDMRTRLRHGVRLS